MTLELSKEIVDELFKKGPNPLLHSLVEKNAFGIIKFFLEGVKMYNPEILKLKNYKGDTILYQSMMNPNLEIVKYVFDTVDAMCPDIKFMKNEDEESIAFPVMENTNIDVVKFILEKDDNRDIIKENKHYTILQHVTKNTNDEVIKYVFDSHSSLIPFTNRFSESCVNSLFSDGNIKVVEYIFPKIPLEMLTNKTLLFSLMGSEDLEVIKYVLPKLDITEMMVLNGRYFIQEIFTNIEKVKYVFEYVQEKCPNVFQECKKIIFDVALSNVEIIEYSFNFLKKVCPKVFLELTYGKNTILHFVLSRNASEEIFRHVFDFIFKHYPGYLMMKNSNGETFVDLSRKSDIKIRTYIYEKMNLFGVDYLA